MQRVGRGQQNDRLEDCLRDVVVAEVVNVTKHVARPGQLSTRAAHGAQVEEGEFAGLVLPDRCGEGGITVRGLDLRDVAAGIVHAIPGVLAEHAAANCVIEGFRHRLTSLRIGELLFQVVAYPRSHRKVSVRVLSQSTRSEQGVQ